MIFVIVPGWPETLYSLDNTQPEALARLRRRNGVDVMPCPAKSMQKLRNRPA